VATFDLTTKSWFGPARRLDVKEYENTQSTMPSIAVNSAGVPLIAWEDFRNILPNVYVSGSYDGGKTWTIPQNTQRSGIDLGIVSKVMADGSNYLLQYQSYQAGIPKAPVTLIVRLIKPEMPSGFGPFPVTKTIPQDQKKNLLNKRVEAFWRAREEKKWGETYKMFDPTYRSMLTEEEFSKQQVFKYLSAKIAGVKIDGNIAKVEIDASFEVPPTVVFGHQIKQEKRDARIDQTWLWIGDDWYVQADMPITHSGFIQY
jgi:hypothetical protein